MTLPATPVNDTPVVPLADRLLAAWMGLGAVAVVLIAQPSSLFDLDRFAAPKELALHVTALGALLLMLIKAPPRLTLVAAETPLLAFTAWSALSALFATNHWVATRALSVTISALVLFRAGRRVSERGAGRTLFTGLAVALVLAGLTGLAQAYGFETTLLAESRAPGGTLGNRNFLAHLMAIGAPILILLLFETPRRRLALLAAGGFGVMIGAMFLTRSRAAWLGFTVSGGVMLVAWLIARRGGRIILPRGRFRLVATAAVLSIAAALLLPNRLLWKSDSPYSDTMRDLTNYREGSGRGRLIQYRNSLKLIAIDPIFGTGPGNWPVKYPMVTTRGDPSFAGADPMPTNPWPSSDWVAFLTERGVVGAALLLAVFGAIGLTALRRLRAEDPAEARRAVTLLGVLTATLATGAFDAVLLLAPPTLIVWSSLGALLPGTGRAAELPVPLRTRLVPLVALFLIAGVVRSTGQVRAIAVAGPGWPVERLERAARFDPGSYRLHLMIAQRVGCTRAKPHATAAARLFPELPAPRRRLEQCR